MLKDLIHSSFIDQKIIHFKNELIKECVEQRYQIKGKGSFLVKSKYQDHLYNIFINEAKKNLNKFTLKSVDLEIWCYISDNEFNDTGWHNHTEKATINCVMYLITQNKGIDFKLNNEELHLKPKDNEMLIFPAFLMHYPHPSKTEKRITLNLELLCNETDKEIFNVQ